MNYFLDQSDLVIPDQNLYTAIELATLIPVYNQREYARLMTHNRWMAGFLPNDPGEADQRFLVRVSKERLKSLAEWLISRIKPDKINRLLMEFTDRKWRKKWSRRGFPMEEYDQAFHTTLHVSKNHPANFQKRILSALKENQTLNRAEI
jgi:hypothetical protein